MSRHIAYIGRTPDAERVYVEISLQTKDGTNFRTTAHEPAGEYTELSIMGMTVDFRGRQVSSAGQINMHVSKVNPEKFSYWTRSDIRSLFNIWRWWHLNGMTPGCDHMELPADTSYDARKHIVCPETGYRYGSAWLVRELPADVIAEVERLMALPAGRIPDYVR
jgi:hypothetical protein